MVRRGHEVEELSTGLTIRGIALVLLMTVMVLTYIVYGVIIALILLLVLASIVITTYYRVKAFEVSLDKGYIRVTRLLPNKAIAGEKLEVTLLVENKSPLLIDKLIVMDTPSNHMYILRSPVILLDWLEPGSLIKRSYRVVPRIGRNEFDDLIVRACDFLSIYCAQAYFKQYNVLEVLPPFIPSRHALALEATIAAGMTAYKYRGLGTIFYGIREYRANDPSKLIDWKHSLKTLLQKLYVKEFEAESPANLILVLLFSNKSFMGLPLESPFERILLSSLSILRGIVRGYAKAALLIATPLQVLGTSYRSGSFLLNEAMKIASSVTWPGYEEVYLEASYKPPDTRTLVARLNKVLSGIRERTQVLLIYHLSGYESLGSSRQRIIDMLSSINREHKLRLLIAYGTPISRLIRRAMDLATKIMYEANTTGVTTSIAPYDALQYHIARIIY
ncbi:MAG: DUF58 domain-containing protein [Pyrodictiaceae archaeon]